MRGVDGGLYVSGCGFDLVCFCHHTPPLSCLVLFVTIAMAECSGVFASWWSEECGERDRERERERE
jgi:hypothetical protein